MLKLPCGPPWTRKAIGSVPVASRGFSVQPQTRVAVGALEAELLERDRVELGEQLAVDVGQLGGAAAGVEAVESSGAMMLFIVAIAPPPASAWTLP